MRWAALVLVAGCALAPTDSAYRDYRGVAIRVTPPAPAWLAGYAGAEVCSGRHGDVRRIRWHIVPGERFMVGSLAVIGYADGKDIYLAQSEAEHIWLARHEALHTLGVHHADSLMQARCRSMPPYVAETL